MVTNCKAQSQRELYVSKLMEFISIDIYGKCGPLNCSKYDDQNCVMLLDKNYKFYLR